MFQNMGTTRHAQATKTLTGARTGQASGKIRGQGPIVRKRGTKLSASAVLQQVDETCPPTTAVTWALRDALFGEDWKEVEEILGEGQTPRSIMLWETAFCELTNVCWQLNRGMRRRQSRPVWAETPSKLIVLSNVNTRVNSWVQTLMLKRAQPDDGEALLSSAKRSGALAPGVALGVLCHLADATIDDMAAMCEVKRADVYQLVWKHAEPPQ